MNLLPFPRSLERRPGIFLSARGDPFSDAHFSRSRSAPDHPEGYVLKISKGGIEILFRESSGKRAALATLRQLTRQYGRRLPCLEIRDWPDFARRGVMLDISRGRVPKLETLLDLAERLADFKINELQLYTEHTFAYRRYKSAWRDWGALTASDLRKLDARCRELGIDLVPNQNSFGHLRYLLEHPRLKRLAEVAEPYEDANGQFVRRPTTLAPNHPETIPFLRGLYDELLPNFSSRFFNVGCDETWDLGRGRSKQRCARRGKGPVYLDFLKKVHREVSARGRKMMFWGDIILKYPKLIRDLPKDAIALNWGYEADHPFEREAALFAKSKIPFYVCPGTSTWMTMVGRHDNAFANLRAAAKAGKRFGAIGFLNTDWGDGGHPQPLAVSWPLFVAGAALAWNGDGFDERQLSSVLSRDVFHDPSKRAADAALKLGRAHRKLRYSHPNSTPLGSVIAAPPAAERELFCRDGLTCFASISDRNIRSCLAEIETQRASLARATAKSNSGRLMIRELDLAARMAAQSCKFMLWQKASADGDLARSSRLAKQGIAELTRLARDFNTFWPKRNKATAKMCSAFLDWRIADYRRPARRTSS